MIFFLHFVEFAFVIYLLSVYNAVLCLLSVYNADLCLLSVYNAVLYLLSVYNAVLCVMFCFFFNTEQYFLCGWTYFNFFTSLKIQRPGYVCLYEHALLVFDWMLCKQAA